MANSALSILILGGFFGFLLIVSHLAIRQLFKGWKLHQSNKQFDGIRSGHKPKPIYFQRGSNDSFHDFDTLQEWDDLGVVPIAKRRAHNQEFKTDSQTNS